MTDVQVESGRATTAAPGLFTRKATGLVREGRTRDALFYNLMWSSVALVFAFYWLFYAFYPGSNGVVGVLIAAVVGLPGAFLYALLTHMMPRTGGDYVFNSRSLHPALGFAANFCYSVWLAITLGVYTTYLASYGFGAFGRTMAGFGAGHGWLSFGNWFSTHWGLFVTGTVLLVLSALIFAFGGLRLFFRIQVWCFVLYVLGGLILPVIVGAVTSHSAFLAHFNDYGRHLGASHATQALAASAAKAGYAPAGFSLEFTVKSLSVWWFIFGFIYASNYFAGEIRMGKRTNLFAMPGALAIAVMALLIMVPSYTHMVGYSFSSQLGLAVPSAYGFGAGAPAYPELVGIGAGSPVVGIIAIIGFGVGLLIWLPQTMLLVSRNIFAWSFDGVMPQLFSRVDPRSRSPLISIGLMLVLGIGSTAIYAFTTWFSALSILLGLTIPLLVTALSGIVIPFTQPQLVANSPYNKRLLGLPLLSIVGFLSLLGFGFAIGVLLWDTNSGVSLSKNPGKLGLALGTLVAGAVIWYIARAIRKAQGVELDLAYQELPAA
jgi:APA family basic amino acid/polyamine antiporter